MKRTIVTAAIFFLFSSGLGHSLSFNRILLPPGFSNEVYAEGLYTARGIAFSDNGTLSVGFKSGYVFAVTTNRKVTVIAKGPEMPVHLDFCNGDVCISKVSRNVKPEEIDNKLDAPPKPEVVNDIFPSERWYGWKFIKTGPDGTLFESDDMSNCVYRIFNKE